MKSVSTYEASDFSFDGVRKAKGDRLIYVVLPTRGEREAGLIADKVVLIREVLGNLVDWIFIAHRRTGSEPDAVESRIWDRSLGINLILCNTLSVPDMGSEAGKGADMRRALYYINRSWRAGRGPDDIIVLFLDADVAREHFGSHYVLGLAGAVLEGNDFAKASFWRAMGRLKKYVAQPLFSVIEHEKLRTLTEFFYPLSGEVAGTMSFYNSVSFWQRYGVETGIGIDTGMGSYRVADVNVGFHDHDHQDDLDLQKMSFGIIRTYLLQLIEYGIIKLADDAHVSDVFRASYIDDRGIRREFAYDLSEIKYKPLSMLK